jgi:AP-1 complex subunit beta-1
LDENTLRDLIGNLSTLASVYHKPPEAFIKKFAKREKEVKRDDEEDPREKELERNDNILDLTGENNTPSNPSTPQKPGGGINLLDDFDFLSTPAAPVTQKSPKEVVLTADKGYGLQVSAAFLRRDGQVALELTLLNQSPAPVSGVAVQFNKNSFAFSPAGVQMTTQVILPGQSGDATVSVSVNPGQLSSGPASNIIQTALKAGDKVLYFQVAVPLHVLFVENGKLEREEYLNIWKQIAEEHFQDVALSYGSNVDVVTKKLESNRLFFIARRSVQQQEFLYFSAKTTTNAVLLLELSVGPSGSKACVKTRSTELVALFHQTIQSLLN